MLVQPTEDDNGNILLWNGEVFGGLEEFCVEGISDTNAVSQLFKEALAGFDSNTPLSILGTSISEAASRIKGPFAFIYFHRTTGSLHYGRDPFGRRSLLALSQTSLTDNNEQHVLIASVYGGAERTGLDTPPFPLAWKELSVDGVYVQKLSVSMNAGLDTVLGPVLCAWPPSRLRLGRVLVPPPPSGPRDESPICPSASVFLEVLQYALQNRVQRVHSVYGEGGGGAPSPPPPPQRESSTCTIGVLFSGGVDSVLLAALLHRVLPASMDRDVIDLINVTFLGGGEGEGPSPDRLAAVAALGELQVGGGGGGWG